MKPFVGPPGNRRARTSGPVPMRGPVVAVALIAAAVVGIGAAGGFAQVPGAPPSPPGLPGPAGLPLGSTLPLGIPGPSAPGVAQAAPQPAAQPAPPTPQQPNPGAGTPEAPKVGQPPAPYPGALRDPLLSPGPPGLTATPQLTPAAREKLAKYVAKLIDPETTLDLVTGQTRVLVFKTPPFRVQSGDEAVLAVNVVTPRELLLQGKEVGATVLNVWFGDKDDPAKQETLTYLVRVFPDPEAKERLERAYKALEDDINRYFKDTSIRLKVVGDKLLVSGRVRDYVQGVQVLQIIRANTTRGSDQGKLPVTPVVPSGGIQDPTGATNTPGPELFATAGGPSVINLLEVAGEQQVMLRVVVAEVNRAAARSIGLNFTIRNDQGITVFSNRTGPVTGFTGGAGGIAAAAGGVASGGGALANLPFTVDAGRVPFALNALKNLQYAKSLAEPNLVTLNGQTASFLAGGQFPVPVIAGVGGFGGLQGVSYVPYGVQLNYTPFITDRDRIRLILNTTVSTRDLSASTNIGGGSVAGLNTRNVNTTVELRQGETLAIAGLISYDIAGDQTKIPFIGDIPGLGPLTGLHRTQSGEKELVIFITPDLVRPLDPDQVVKLPGWEILDPNDVEFYLIGRIEGHCRDYRSPIRTDLSRIKQYHQTEAVNVPGPTGYTPIP